MVKKRAETGHRAARRKVARATNLNECNFQKSARNEGKTKEKRRRLNGRIENTKWSRLKIEDGARCKTGKTTVASFLIWGWRQAFPWDLVNHTSTWSLFTQLLSANHAIFIDCCEFACNLAFQVISHGNGCYSEVHLAPNTTSCNLSTPLRTTSHIRTLIRQETLWEAWNLDDEQNELGRDIYQLNVFGLFCFLCFSASMILVENIICYSFFTARSSFFWFHFFSKPWPVLKWTLKIIRWPAQLVVLTYDLSPCWCGNSFHRGCKTWSSGPDSNLGDQGLKFG